MRTSSLLIALAVLLAVPHLRAADDPIEIDATDDTWLSQEHTGKPAGRGAKDEMQLYGTGDEKTNRAILKFDLKGVPGGFRAAVLRLTCYNGHYTANTTSYLHAHAITKPWNEDNASWDQSTGGSNWPNPGGTWDPKPAAACRLYGPLGGEKARVFDFEITALARQWQAQPNLNFGVAIMLEKSCGAELRMRSKDHNVAGQRPKLRLYYRGDPDKSALSIPVAEVPPCEPYDPQAPAVRLSAGVDALKVGQEFEAKFTASGAKDPYAFQPAGPPVPGLTLQPDGTWKGKPSRAGVFVVGVACVAGNGKRATDWRRVVVLDPNAAPPKPPADEPEAKTAEGKTNPPVDEAKTGGKPKKPTLEDE
ncbi:MAG: DNRLRE domain-containing protein [Planctomycetota bacterium]|nr:DNRLRE domain-containing protein [Planctomycetota bacterium]